MKTGKKPGKKIWMAVSFSLVVVIASGSIGYSAINTGTDEVQTTYQETTLQQGNLTMAFSEDGTTQISTDSQLPEFSVNTVTMTVSEVYVAAGDTVCEGDALFQISEESMTAAKEYYAAAVSEASTALETAQLNYETGVAEAKNAMQISNLDADTAEASLQAALTELEQSVQDKLDEWEQAQEDIETYTVALENNTYYTEAGVEEKESAQEEAQSKADAAKEVYQTADKAYEDAKSVLKSDIDSLAKAGSESAETWTTDTISSIQALAQAIAADYENVDAAKAVLAEKEQAYNQANQALQQAKQEKEQAEQQYEQNTSEAEKKLEELEEKLSSLQSAYEAAVRSAETRKVDLQNSYEESLLEGEYADDTYAATVTELENAVADAKETLEELTEEQNALLALENGVVCASQDGTIASITYDVEDVLFANTAFVTYYNTETIMISVEVAQEDIAKVAVGDEVSVAVSGNRMGEVTGTVSSIASSATTGGSVSSVTYAVVVSIDNTDGTLSSGSSATVSFTYGALTDVYYIDSNAVSNVSGSTGTVLQYNENGEVTEVSVTIGDITDQYTVIEEGISEGDICLIEVEGASDNEK